MWSRQVTSAIESLGRRIGLGGRNHSFAVASVGALAALALAAVINQRLARSAERRNSPRGHFLDIDGVRLHYVERGSGEPLLLLHGNGSMIQDFDSSGLLAMAARKYRVIVPDRPGYGYSNRPRDRLWSPGRQADLIHDVLIELDATPAVVLGHSWGASVAVQLALRHPESVKALVLASGYYYPTARVDALMLSPPALPIIGDILRHTISPLLVRLMWPGLMRKIFGPKQVPEKFRRGFPVGLAVRPSQLRASASESGMMIPDALALRAKYRPGIAGGDRCRRCRPPDRQQAPVGAAAPRARAQQLPPGRRLWPHGPPDCG